MRLKALCDICKVDSVLSSEYEELRDSSIMDISKKFKDNDSDFYIILKDKKPFYIFTSTDIIDALVSRYDDIAINEYIERFPKNIISFSKNDYIFNAYKMMRTHRIRHIVITEDNGDFFAVITSNHLATFLTEIAIKDDMTHLYNKRFFDFIKDRHAAGSTNFGILFVDIDKFKEINDTYGHEKGDEIIKRVAETIKKSIRDIDYAFRFGGDEFMIMLFPDDIGADKVKERILKNIKDIKIDDIPISISIGTATMPKDGDSIDEILKVADERMYEEKRRHHQFISESS